MTTVFPFDIIPKMFCPYCLNYVEARRWLIGNNITFNYECITCGKEFRIIDCIIAINNTGDSNTYVV